MFLVVFFIVVLLNNNDVLAKEESYNFTDIGGIGTENKLKIEKLVSMGIIKGYPDGSFRPGELVTRGNFAAFISRALDLETSANDLDIKNFNDVSKNSSSYKEIMGASEYGIIVGYPDGSFKPNKYISKKDMAIMLDRALQLKRIYNSNNGENYFSDISNSKYSETIDRVIYYGLLKVDGDKFEPNNEVNRLNTVISIYNLLEVRGFLTDFKSFKLEDYFTDVKWITRGDTISLSINPTNLLTVDTFGENKVNHISNSFDILFNKFKDGIEWKNSESLKVQYECHVYFAGNRKVPWNIEPHRTETDFGKTVINSCNP